MDPTGKFERCASVNEALLMLRHDWSNALAAIQARFDFGVLAGTEVQSLFDALDVELREVPPFPHISSPIRPLSWRPRFSIDLSGARRVLEVPSDHLIKHKSVMSASYVLRAYANDALRWTIPDVVERNEVLRDEVDRCMFGDYHHFRRRLSDYGSLQQIHADDIPIQLVGGYLAKHDPTTTLESFYAITPYHGHPDGSITPVVSPAVRHLGLGQPLNRDLHWLRTSGSFPFHRPQVCHVVEKAKADIGRLLVAVSRPLYDIVDAASGEPLVLVNKAVLWSCGLADLQRMFARPMHVA